MKSAKLLLVDFASEEGLRDVLRTNLESLFSSDISIQEIAIAKSDFSMSQNELSKAISRARPSLIFFLLSQCSLLPAGQLLQVIKQNWPVIVVIDTAEPNAMLDLLKFGATDFISVPLRSIDIAPRVWRLLEQNKRSGTVIQTLKEKFGTRHLVGESAAFVAEINKFPILAKCDVNVLILGETGTGKELCARAIHYLSPRSGKPFVPVNCGAIPTELVENELFGHEREAFSGAVTSRHGLIHEADGGTLFLDEIDCLPLLAQVKLLRFLQEKEYRPLGSMKMRQADVRVMAASNANLDEAVRKGELRQDLYYRLNVISVLLPPLRDRQEDIPLLAQHFLAKYADRFNKHVTDFSPDAMQELMMYGWPGNVRELEHVIERAIVLSEQQTIVSMNIGQQQMQTDISGASFQETKARMIAQFEKIYIQKLLRAHQGNITKAAQAARKDRRALRHLIRKHKIDVQSFKECVLSSR